ncbi:putative Zinc transporter ZIP10 [Hypsibius exemplaris]|uniref:Zinc transporter ZIP10 n=1 Tax=Hypsibius exemplaris TaxID=2072580 RepID=A0A1W0X381_HYPEX|nr:putative Zinc transporter ZIP10 [Hypsibius exemplaris]
MECLSIYDWRPWVYASCSILVLSLVGLLGILLVPIVNRVLYNHLLQFLVAMAAGALSGDALMHLLPEALGLHSHAYECTQNASTLEHDHHDHVAHNESSHSDHLAHEHEHNHDAFKTIVVWRSCVCFAGIYVFFLIERLMGIFREYKRRKEAEAETPSKKDLPKHQHDHCHSHVVGFKLSGTSANQCVMPCDAAAEQNGVNGNLDQMAMQTLLCGKEEPSSNALDRTADTVGHGHSHHGHSHRKSSLPNNIASVAWMVILGDGIHNLIDGLSVGVAYRTAAGGLSTSLAVLLHEIPHELGDFAVLLRAGMSVKLAVFYNMVSSVISFIGMIIGVILGQSHNETGLWIFALAAGGFLYIALVDLLPELRPVEARKDESPLWHLVLQNFGLLTGAGIMVLIAYYEEDIKATIRF